MPSIASDALVLRAYKMGETSKIVVLLTRERGKVRAVAKGARGPRSRYQSALEPLSEVRVGLYGRQGAELYRLGECELLHSAFLVGRKGLETSLTLSYFTELLDAFAQEGEAEDPVYRLAIAVVRAAEEGREGAVLARYLEAWLLRLHGLYPPLDRCARCASRLAAGALPYDATARGFLCPSCQPASGPVLPPAARAFLEEAFRQAPAAMTGPLSDEESFLEGFHKDLISHHLERGLRSHRVLKDVAREIRG
jgi:DNA repair protein RecO (recombination protein O)